MGAPLKEPEPPLGGLPPRSSVRMFARSRVVLVVYVPDPPFTSLSAWTASEQKAQQGRVQES